MARQKKKKDIEFINVKDDTRTLDEMTNEIGIMLSTDIKESYKINKTIDKDCISKIRSLLDVIKLGYARYDRDDDKGVAIAGTQLPAAQILNQLTKMVPAKLINSDIKQLQKDINEKNAAILNLGK